VAERGPIHLRGDRLCPARPRRTQTPRQRVGVAHSGRARCDATGRGTRQERHRHTAFSSHRAPCQPTSPTFTPNSAAPPAYNFRKKQPATPNPSHRPIAEHRLEIVRPQTRVSKVRRDPVAFKGNVPCLMLASCLRRRLAGTLGGGSPSAYRRKSFGMWSGHLRWVRTPATRVNRCDPWGSECSCGAS
jgi:hypothetical protein